MTDRKAHTIPLVNQLLLVLMGVVLLYLVVSFIRQVGLSYQQREELEMIQQRIDAAIEEKAKLEVALEYARSEAAVAKWGRRHNMIQEGEVLLVPVGDIVETVPEAEASQEEGVEPSSPRYAWWDLFFGRR
jgi:cell division protein FtsL